MVAHAAGESTVIPWLELPPADVGAIEVDLPALLAIGGTLAAMGVARRRARLAGLSVRRMMDGFALSIAAGLLFGPVFDALLYRFQEFRADWHIALPWQGGFCSLGVAAGVFLACAAAFRNRKGGLSWDYLDPLAAGFLLGLGILRFGCFLGHHHAGRLSASLLAVDYPGGPRHDLGLYESLLAFALFAALAFFERRAFLAPGFAAVGAGCAYAAGRFGIEMLRGDDLELLGRHSDPRYGGLTLVQYSALVALTAGLVWIRLHGRSALPREAKASATPPEATRARGVDRPE